MNENKREEEALEYFKIWLYMRELSEEATENFMFMNDDAKFYYFKNRTTRQYIDVSKEYEERDRELYYKMKVLSIINEKTN